MGIEDTLDTYAAQQGWDENSQIIQLVGYLEMCIEAECAPSVEHFNAYLMRCAEEENAPV